MKISTSGIVIYTTQHNTLQSYGDLILAIHQELGDHRFDHKLGTQTQKGYMLIPLKHKTLFVCMYIINYIWESA